VVPWPGVLTSSMRPRGLSMIAAVIARPRPAPPRALDLAWSCGRSDRRQRAPDPWGRRPIVMHLEDDNVS